MFDNARYLLFLLKLHKDQISVFFSEFTDIDSSLCLH